jgi:hypothetical protein
MLSTLWCIICPLPYRTYALCSAAWKTAALERRTTPPEVDVIKLAGSGWLNGGPVRLPGRRSGIE